MSFAFSARTIKSAMSARLSVRSFAITRAGFYNNGRKNHDSSGKSFAAGAPDNRTEMSSVTAIVGCIKDVSARKVAVGHV